MKLPKYCNHVSLAALLIAGIPAACTGASVTGDSDQEPSEATGTTGLALTTDTLADTDVGGMRFEITRVSCDGEDVVAFSVTEERDLEDIMLPGGIGEFENAPLDSESEHVFSDLFFVLDAGCYDVVTTPLTADGAVSEDCAPADYAGVEIEESQTTEIVLINQCEGEDSGAIDVVSIINHPPHVDAVEFSKFGETCVARTICATASDPDGDPLEFVWNVTGDVDFDGPTVVSSSEGENGVTQCIEVTVNAAGSLAIDLTVYDLVHGDDGELMRVEDWLAAEGYPNESRAELEFPLYASGEVCEEGEGGSGAGGGGGEGGVIVSPPVEGGSGGASGGEGGATEAGSAGEGGEVSPPATGGAYATGGAASGGAPTGGYSHSYGGKKPKPY